MSLQSALIGFLLSKFFPTPISAQENIVLQTTAVATGTVRSPPMGKLYINDSDTTRCLWLQALLVSCLPLVYSMKQGTASLPSTSHGGQPSHGPWLSLFSGGYVHRSLHVSCCLRGARVFLSPPLRKQVVRKSGASVTQC